MSRGPRGAGVRRSWGDDDSRTPILHVDMDAFFVEVELLERPHLRGLPIAVGGSERGVISSASYEARRFGVNSAMPVARAKQLCPDLIIIPTTSGKYSAVSRRIMEILRAATPLVEQVSVDEAFLDVSLDAKRTPLEIAADLRAKIRAAEGVPASIGIAATKHVAKIASAHAKPDGVLLVPKEATSDFLLELPLGAMWGVGSATLTKLERAGLTSVADIRALRRRDLESLLGLNGGHLWDLAHGIDPRRVVTSREEKSIGKEETYFDLLTTRQEVAARMLHQAHECASRLRSRGWLARTVTIKVRDASFHTITRSHTMSAPTQLAREIYRVADSLLVMPIGGVRLIGVRVEGLVRAGGTQGQLGDNGRTEQAERALDSIREKFGRGVVVPGTLLPPTEGSGYDGQRPELRE